MCIVICTLLLSRPARGAWVEMLTMTALGVPPPDVLTERWFKAWTTELVVVAGIKIFRKDDTAL